jgi:hypothetical protein
VWEPLLTWEGEHSWMPAWSWRNSLVPVGVFPLVSWPNDLHVVRRKAIHWLELTSAFIILATSVIGVGVTWTSVVGSLPNKALAANVLLLVTRLMTRL